MGGDLNCHLNPSLDKLPSDISPLLRKRGCSLICPHIEYSDVWRQLYPTASEFTFFSAPHKSYTRIDYIFIPSSKMCLALSYSIGNNLLSDNAPLYLLYSLAKDRAMSRC